MSEEEKQVIEEVQYFITNGIDEARPFPIDDWCEILLSIIEKQQKEIKIHKDNFEGLSADITQVLKDLGLSEETIIADEMVVEIKKKFVSKDKIREKLKELKQEGSYFSNGYYDSGAKLILEELLEE